ncbi:MAG: type VI secretion system-associated FHA domain protein TagH [Paracoccaceae bacterium]
MTLTLKIENYDVLEDGGPAQITVQGAGLTAGRGGTMDWVLPDPGRHISTRHFEVAFSNGAYFLTDVSTNGIFLKGQPYRLQGPHQIADNDRFQVGHYIVVASLGGSMPASAPAPSAFQPAPSPAAQAPLGGGDADPWSLGPSSHAPIDPSPRADHSAFEDFSSEFIVNPDPIAPPPMPPRAPDPAPQAAPHMPADAGASPFGAHTHIPGPAQTPPAAPLQSPPGQAPSASPFGAPPAGPSAAPQPEPPQPAAPGMAPAQPFQAPAPAPAAAPLASAGDPAAFARAFCEGAGLSPDLANSADSIAMARELGRTLRVATQELMALLQDRASAKQFTKSGDRTMMGATANNPLKFLPTPDQALTAMFLQPKDGFMHGADGLAEAFGDVRLHQSAVFAAIQPALAKLLMDISPEAIEEKSGSGLLGAGRKGKAWETFVERWDAKVEPHENGMLDVFLAHFAEAYAAAIANARQ